MFAEPFHSASCRSAVLSRDAVRQLDCTAIERFGIPGLVLMENAARGMVEILLDWLKRNRMKNDRRERERETAPFPTVLIFCGTGNNAGDGLAAARHFQLRGIPHRVILCADPARLRGDALFQYELARKLRIPMVSILPDLPISVQLDTLAAEVETGTETAAETESAVFPAVGKGGLCLVDALLGTGAVGVPRFPMPEVIAWMNARRKLGTPVFAVDVPTGLDCETGVPFAPDPASDCASDPVSGGTSGFSSDSVVRASLTVTFAAAKPGMVLPHAEEFTGTLYVSDIGVAAEALLGN